MHSAADPFKSSKPRTQLQASAHIAADLLNHPKTLCTHSCRGRPRTQLGLKLSYKQALALHQFILHQKPKWTSLQECLFIVHLLQNHGLKPWAPRTLNPGLKPWVYYKKEGFYSTLTPLRLF